MKHTKPLQIGRTAWVDIANIYPVYLMRQDMRLPIKHLVLHQCLIAEICLHKYFTTTKKKGSKSYTYIPNREKGRLFDI